MALDKDDTVFPTNVAGWTINRDIALLHYKFSRPVQMLLDNLARLEKSGATKAHFEMFEGFRHPSRQDEVFKQGASKARAWQSAHQYGLAADIVGMTKGKWDWNLPAEDWRLLKREAGKVGLTVPLANDMCHVQSPLWLKIRKEMI